MQNNANKYSYEALLERQRNFDSTNEIHIFAREDNGDKVKKTIEVYNRQSPVRTKNTVRKVVKMIEESEKVLGEDATLEYAVLYGMYATIINYTLIGIPNNLKIEEDVELINTMLNDETFGELFKAIEPHIHEDVKSETVNILNQAVENIADFEDSEATLSLIRKQVEAEHGITETGE